MKQYVAERGTIWKNAKTVTVLGGVGLTLMASSMSAHAQFYKGEAYGANIAISAPLIGVGATIVQNPSLPASGSSTKLTNQLLDANITANTGTVALPVVTSVLGAGVIDTWTMGTGGVATSDSKITGLSLYPSLSAVVPVLSSLGLGALVTADVIESNTTATAGGNSGTTQIANLHFGAASLGNFNLTNASSITYYMTALGSVSLNANAGIIIPDIATLTINNQFTTDSGKTRTTEAVSVTVLPGNGLASGKVVVASSTAGINVPEPSALPLALMGLAGVGQLVRRRRVCKN